MTMIFDVPGATTGAIAERERLVGVLGELCELEPERSAADCGRTWCGYFDEQRGRCGLLVWDIPARLGPGALRWFIEHRTPRPPQDDPLIARTAWM